MKLHKVFRWACGVHHVGCSSVSLMMSSGEAGPPSCGTNVEEACATRWLASDLRNDEYRGSSTATSAALQQALRRLWRKLDRHVNLSIYWRARVFGPDYMKGNPRKRASTKSPPHFSFRETTSRRQSSRRCVRSGFKEKIFEQEYLRPRP